MVLCFGPYELDEDQFELRSGGARVPVQPKVLDVLRHLVRARDRVVLKKELLDAVWPGVVVSEASVSRVIMEARRAIGDELHQVVVTVRGRGFRFTAPVVEKERLAAPPPPDPRAADPTFVGRAACLAVADAKLEEALAGHGSSLWLSGEAGIGKSRTAEEIARRARARSALVLHAHAHETPETPPFWLWAQLLRGHPEPPLGEIADLSAGTQAPGGAQEFQLFDAAARWLREAARASPVVLVMDDLHWSDEGSLRLLQFLVRELRQAPVWTVATYRDTALRGDGRARILGDLLRERGSVSFALRGLGLDEVVQLVEVVAGSSPSPELARSLLDRSGGNPLYVQQLLGTEWAQRALTERAHALASSMDLQQGLIESICRHVDSMSPEARELLEVAAVLGGEVDLAKLLVVVPLPSRDLMDRLDEAAGARILVKAKDGGYRFAHALVGDVLYKKLSSAERVARHRDIADKLLAHYGQDADAHAAELSRHFARALPASDPVRAIELSIRAAEQQTALGSPRAAVRLWQQALGAFAHVKGHEAQRARVQLELARALARSGDARAASEAFQEAVALARTLGLTGELADLEAAVQAALSAAPA